MSISHCPHCNFEVSSEALFCPNCGTNLPERPPQETPAKEEVSEDTSQGICQQCGTSHESPIPSHCRACGHPLLETEEALAKREETREGISVDVPKPGERERVKPPSIQVKKLQKPVMIFLGIIAIGVLAYLGLKWLVDDGIGGGEIPACQPIKPGEDFEEANQRNISDEFRQNAYFKSGEEYTIDRNAVLKVPKNITLIVEPGARIRFGEGSRLVVEGTLLACGKRSRRILFTADTTSGRPGFWAGIEIQNADPDSVIGHATFEFAGRDGHAPLWVEQTNLQLEDLKFDSNQWYSVSIDPGSSPKIRSSIEVENGLIGWEIRGGTIASSQEWLADHPYIINGVVKIDELATLTLQESVVVRFLPGSVLQTLGQMIAVGSSKNPILFTSAYDADEETVQEPLPGDWGGLQFTGRKKESKLENVEIRYAGGVNQLSGCLWLGDAEPILKNITISDCAAYSISSDILSDLRIEDFVFTEEDPTRWWEIREGELKTNVSQSLSTSYVDNEGIPLLPVITGWISVGEDAELILETGAKLLFGGNNTGIYAQGILRVLGEDDDPVVMTSWRDESFGGGGATPGDWASLVLQNSLSDKTSLSNLEIRYAGAGNVKQNGCIRLDAASPRLMNVVVRDCATYPISSDISSAPDIDGLDIGENIRSNLWEIYTSSLEERREWRWAPLESLDGEPIIRTITGQILVEEAATLILDPGLVLAFEEEAALAAQGALLAKGTLEEPILLTSWRDPVAFEGQIGAQPGDWYGVILDNSQTSKKLSHLEIRYAGSTRRNLGGLTLNNASPVLSHVTLSKCSNYPIHSDLASVAKVEELILSDNQPQDAWAIRESSLESGVRKTFEPLYFGEGDVILPRIALGPLTIKQEATLSLAPGVVIGFHDRANLRVKGSLIVEGNAASPVILTSWRDPEFSHETAANAGDWGGVLFDKSGGNNILSFVEIRYAGSGYPPGAISFVASNARLSDLVVRDSSWYPISLSLEDKVTLERVDFLDNLPANAIEVRGSTLNVAGETIWTAIVDSAMQQILRVVTGNLKINEGASLRIKPETVVKFDNDAGFEVRGTFRASGAVFTSIYDDSHGGETDGGTEGSLQWKGFRVYGDGNLAVEDTLIRFAENGLHMEGGMAQLGESRIEDSIEAAINADFISQVELMDLVLQGNGVNGLALRGNSLPKGRTTWGLLGAQENQIVRVIRSELEIGTDAQLVIEPGVIVKFAPQAGLTVNGQLAAGESGGERITFTALADDSVGDDTDGILDEPSRGSWVGVVVNPKKANALLTLMNVTIRFASNGLYLVELPEWEYEGLIISDSQYYGLSCDAASYFITDDPDLELLDNGEETVSCPTPDR